MEKLEEKKEEYMTKKNEMQELINQEKTKLSEVANLTPQEAKEQIIEHVKQESEEEIRRYITKYKMIKEEEAKEE
jgi:ribonuclease Y